MKAEPVPQKSVWSKRRHALTLVTGLLVAITACVLPLLSQQQSESVTQKKLGYAFSLRNSEMHKHFMESLDSGEVSKLQLARASYLEQDYQAALSQLRLNPDLDNSGVKAGDDEGVAEFQKILEQNLLYHLPWPEKIVAWLSAEMDGEKDPILVRLVDPGLGPSRNLRLDLLAWRNQRYRSIEPEPYSLDGQTRRETVVPIHNFLALSIVNLYRPKESSKGQIFLSYLSDHQDYIAETYLLKDGHLRRYRWVSQRPIVVKQDHMEVYNSDLKKTETWVMRVEKWHAEKNP